MTIDFSGNSVNQERAQFPLATGINALGDLMLTPALRIIRYMAYWAILGLVELVQEQPECHVMYINVKLLTGYSQMLTYSIPETWDIRTLVGSFVRVPLRNKVETALVCAIVPELEQTPSFTIKQAYAREVIPADTIYHEFIRQLGLYNALEPLALYKRLRQFLVHKEHSEITLVNYHEREQEIPATQAILTTEQQAIVNFLKPHIEQPEYKPTLLHGVTGSGKTEVYKKLIEYTYIHNKTTILLLPEVTLAVQFTTLLQASLNKNLLIYGFHSASSAQEKRALWQHLLKSKKPCLIIGVHLPMLLPVPHLGLIIVDEEHEVGYQEKKHPRINTKEAALLRAKLQGIPILLGSATPSLASLYLSKNRGWDYFQLKQRFAGAFPTIKLVKLDTKTKRSHFWISKELQEALAIRLNKKEQCIIFLNRRGYSFFVQCTDCTFIFTCRSCSVSLTLHNTHDLICHYCGFAQKLPECCPACEKTALLKRGIGTQQVVTILEKLFPNARIGRADLDATRNKKKWQHTLNSFYNRELDILVGTQTITKGYHFPYVTLVGILWADNNLHFPVYNAAEVTLQQLIQVAGRAGRQSPESLVIVQTLIRHPIFAYLSETDYLKFYDYELAYRQSLGYPPCLRFAELELRHTDSHILDTEAEQCARAFDALIENKNLSVTMLGPAQPPVHTIQGVSMRKIYLKGPSMTELITLYNKLKDKEFTSKLFFTPNPLY